MIFLAMKNDIQKKIEFYEYIFDNIWAVIFVINRENGVWYNKRATDLLGKVPLAIKTIEDYQKQFFHSNSKDNFDKAYLNICNREIGEDTYLYRQKDTSDNWRLFLGISNVSVWSDTDLPLEIITCAIDLSERFAKFNRIENLLEENAQLRSKLKLDILSKRETELLELVVAGLSSRQIAKQKNISYHTVETHKKNIHKKLQVTNIIDLVKFAKECGL